MECKRAEARCTSAMKNLPSRGLDGC
jgi:hypothetical protein